MKPTEPTDKIWGWPAIAFETGIALRTARRKRESHFSHVGSAQHPESGRWMAWTIVQSCWPVTARIEAEVSATNAANVNKRWHGGPTDVRAPQVVPALVANAG